MNNSDKHYVDIDNIISSINPEDLSKEVNNLEFGFRQYEGISGFENSRQGSLKPADASIQIKKAKASLTEVKKHETSIEKLVDNIVSEINQIGRLYKQKVQEDLLAKALDFNNFQRDSERFYYDSVDLDKSTDKKMEKTITKVKSTKHSKETGQIIKIKDKMAKQCQKLNTKSKDALKRRLYNENYGAVSLIASKTYEIIKDQNAKMKEDLGKRVDEAKEKLKCPIEEYIKKYLNVMIKSDAMHHAEEIYKLVSFTKVSPMGSHKIDGLSDCLHLANQITELERKYTYLMEVRHVFDMYPIKQSKMYAGITDIMKTIANERTRLYEESRKIYKKNKIDLVVDIMPQLMAIDEKIAQISNEIGRARNTEYHAGKLENDPRIQDLYAKIASLEAERNALASKLPNIKLYNRVEVPKEKTANLEKRPVQESKTAQFSLSGMSYKRDWEAEYQKLAAEYHHAINMDFRYKQMPFSQFISIYKVENPAFKELAEFEAKREGQLIILINSEYPKYCAAMGDKTPLSLEEFLMQNYQVNANDITNRYYIEQYYETQKEKNSGFGSR